MGAICIGSVQKSRGKGALMEMPWHITLEVGDKDWNTSEGLRTLCGAESQKIIRFQLFNFFVKAHSVSESDVCKECLSEFKDKTKGGA
jgi:hypothetical protein